jgi:hypothetical protein
MRKGNRPGSINVGQRSQKPVSGEQRAANLNQQLGEPTFTGGLGLRGTVTRRSKRTLKEDLELVTYNVSFESGSQMVEDIAPPGGPYLSLGEVVDLDVVIRTFADRNQRLCSRLRIARVFGEF